MAYFSSSSATGCGLEVSLFRTLDRCRRAGLAVGGGGMVVAIQKELALPVKFIGLGEKPEDLQPFDPAQFAQALFEE